MYMGLRGYVARRSVYTVVLLFFVITLNFFIFEVMPGSPTDFLANPQYLRDPSQLENAIRIFGLDRPVHERYVIYVRNMLTFNFGYAYGVGTISNTLVSDQIASRLANTLILIGLSSLLAVVIGVFLGVYSASRRGGAFDSLQVTSSLVWGSLPTFWIGLVFILIFSTYLGWFPSAHTQPDDWALHPPQLGTLFAPNWSGVQEFIFGRMRHAILPVAVLSLFQYGGFLLLTRATMIESLTEDYVLTARAKGLRERTVLFRHALKNASLPLITSIALTIGFIFSGAIITETVFSWSGLGRWIFDAIGTNDYPSLQAIFFIIALMVIIANFIADLALGIIDPRIKYG